MPTTDVMDQTETDIRERILITTERLFREIGYQKTTVADIAKTLRMSPANVYRFFDSKRSITAGVVSRQMGDVDQALQAIAGQPQSATERLREMLITIFRMNSERFAGDSKMHEMVAVAMEENWDVCQAHIDKIIAVTARVVGDGMRSGEFRSGGSHRDRALRPDRDAAVHPSAIDRRICRQAERDTRSIDGFRADGVTRAEALGSWVRCRLALLRSSPRRRGPRLVPGSCWIPAFAGMSGRRSVTASPHAA